MSKLKGKLPSRKIDSIKVAKSWLDLGIQPVPIKRRTKKPKDGKGWNTLKVTHETIPHFFKSGDNVGGLWGKPSGWVIDVDLDWDEASLAAPRIFPETFVYGRRNRPSSHYLFKVDGVAGYKRYDSGSGDNANRTVIAEVRSSGAQSVLPPSIHPDGDRYEINHDVEIRSITQKNLELLVNQVSAAALFARYYPHGGGRHDYVHAITGALLWEGWDEDKTRKFARAVLDAAAGKEDDRKQRERTIENTITHFREGNRIAGWRTLSQWLHGQDLKLIKDWLKATKGYEVIQKEFKPRTLQKEQENLEELIRVPGIVGEIAAWSSRKAYLKQPMFDLSVGLMCTALLTMNRFVVDGWDTPLQPYFMLLAPTSGGKESALESVYQFARKVGLGEYVFQGFQSYHSMLDRLATPPNVGVLLWDEAARKMRSANRSQGGQDFQIMTWLLQLYGRANSSSPGIPGRHNAIQAIDLPFFLTMAASQPQQMLEAITDSDIAQGFPNRFVLFDSGDKVPEANLQRSNIFPSRFEEFYKTVKSLGVPSNGAGPFRKIKFDSTATWNLFRDFDFESRRAAFQSDVSGLHGRANQNALIVAGLVAVGVNPKHPIITESIAGWAMKLVTWSTERWRRRVEESSSRTIVEQRSKTVERYIRHAREFAHRAKTDKKAAKLMTDGCLPRSMLTRLCRHMTARDLDDVLNQLIVADLVATGEVQDTEVFWMKD
jgi:hypothetical protein